LLTVGTIRLLWPHHILLGKDGGSYSTTTASLVDATTVGRRRRCAHARLLLAGRSAPEFEETNMVINRKQLISVAVVVVAMFAIANPLGDSHHGLGKHHAFLANLGQGLFVASLIGAVVFVLLAIAALLQHYRRP
jgi:hypothetical protein